MNRCARRFTSGMASRSARPSKSRMKAERNGATRALLETVAKELVTAGAPPAVSEPGGEPHGEAAPAAEPVTAGRVKAAFASVEERIVRELILEGKRPDGRGPKDLRAIRCEVGLLPRAHGSALFQRGETQALVTTVLGTGADEQRGRRHHGRIQQEIHARLQHAALRRRRGAADPRTGPPRDRPWRLGRAVRRTDPAGLHAVSLHDPRGFRHPRIERFQLDGLRLRRHTEPDGRRRADQRSGRGHLDRTGAGRSQRPPHPSDRYRRRRGPLWRHGLQGRRHPAGGHRHPARSQEQRHHRADHSRDPRAGARGPARNPPCHAASDQAAARRDLRQRPPA